MQDKRLPDFVVTAMDKGRQRVMLQANEQFIKKMIAHHREVGIKNVCLTNALHGVQTTLRTGKKHYYNRGRGFGWAVIYMNDSEKNQ